MRSVKVALAGIATFVAIGYGVFVNAAVAHAAWPGSCPVGVSCLATGQNGVGTVTAFPFSTYGDGRCHPLNLQPVAGYHSAHGGYGSGHAFAVSTTFDCTGTTFVLDAGQNANAPTFPTPLKFNSIMVI